MSSEKEDFQKELNSFIQEEGFIWGPEPEIYGGLAGFYTYGPMGKLLKNKEAPAKAIKQQSNVRRQDE